MKAMILAAGLGTRFKPWTDKHPKALALVNGKTLLQRAIEYLQQYDIKDVVVNVHHFADQVEQEIKKNKGCATDFIVGAVLPIFWAGGSAGTAVIITGLRIKIRVECFSVIITLR